jgi:ABC-type branched-subunit amino acid transport system ATPase component
VFEVKDLAVRGELRGATLRLNRGDVAVVHGAGASALVRAAAGLVRPTTGVVRLHGEDLAGLSPRAIAANGVVYVGAAAVASPELTVLENLVAGAAAGSVDGRVERADAVLASLPRLADAMRTPAGALGPSDAAVLAVASAIARRPRLLLLDGLAARAGDAYRDVRHALRLAAADEVVTLVAEPEEPADANEYDTAFAIRRGWLR